LLSLTAFCLAQIGVLLRSVQDNTPQQRETFFLETRSCRRRKQKDPRTTSLVTVFAMTDYYRCVSAGYSLHLQPRRRDSHKHA
jgi:hypothetical protein